MKAFRDRLARRFLKQEEFAQDYAPLYSRLFGLLAQWLARDSLNVAASWLVQTSAGRSSFEIPLLLLAGLHRDILLNSTDTAKLAQYYPTVGGKRQATDPDLENVLLETILSRRHSLGEFINSATVQTNETARGISWLLPLQYTNWEAIHLVDLGASAGLNLVAELRSYRLTEQMNRKVIYETGMAPSVQFEVRSRGEFTLPPSTVHIPSILSRTGCDLTPFSLKTTTDEQTLAAFVWADQIHRMQQLREGLSAFHLANRGRTPVRLFQANLPYDLPHFLNQHLPALDNIPVLLYNTYLTTYLDDRGATLRQHLAAWASKQKRPVLWVQWEPLGKGAAPPEFGWLGWTLDLWQPDNRHDSFNIAWCHPHGTHVQWRPDMKKWATHWV